LATGGKYVTEEFAQSLGGDGANVAIGLSRLGIRTALFSEMGTIGVSTLIREKLRDEEIDMSLVLAREKFANVSAILLSEKGERTIINHRSHHTDLKLTSEVEKTLEKVKLLYLGNMPEMSLTMREEILKLSAAAGNIRVANLGVKDCRLGITKLHRLLKRLNVLILNRFELADLLGLEINEVHPHKVNYTRKFPFAEGSVLVVTDGEFGSYAQTQSEIYFQKALPVKVKDATGAGDAFTSAFTAAMFYGKNIEDALFLGAKNAHSVLQVIGAQDGLLKKEKLFTSLYANI
jgi:sugar/nucleoside kinase (ribokinase family)